MANVPKDIRLTPIPHSDLMAITSAITGTRENMKAIKDTLQEVAKDARKASDGVIQLTGWSKDVDRRISTLEQKPGHECVNETELTEHETRLNEAERLSRSQGEKITAVEKEQAGLTKWRTWLTAIASTIILTLVGASGKAIWDTATARAQVTQNVEDIEALEKARRADREEILQAVKAVPSRVVMPSPLPPVEPEAIDIEAVGNKLRPYQRRQLKQLLDEAGVETQ